MYNRFLNIPTYICKNCQYVHMYLCVNVNMYKCINVFLYICILVKKYLCMYFVFRYVYV